MASLTFDSVLQCLHSLRFESGFHKGYIDGEENYKKFLDDLLKVGVKFCIRRSWTSAKQKSQKPKAKPKEKLMLGNGDIQGIKTEMGSSIAEKLYFKKHKDCTSAAESSPFTVEKTEYMNCKFGPQYRTRKQKDRTFDPNKKRRRRLQESVKQNCPATLTVKRICVFLSHKLKDKNVKQTTRARIEEKKMILGTVANRANAQDNIKETIRFCVKISPMQQHNHKITPAADVAEKVHPMLVKKIYQLVNEGTTTVKNVKLHLQKFIAEEMKSSVHKASLSNRTIKSHITNAIAELKCNPYMALDFECQYAAPLHAPPDDHPEAVHSNSSSDVCPPDNMEEPPTYIYLSDACAVVEKATIEKETETITVPIALTNEQQQFGDCFAKLGDLFNVCDSPEVIAEVRKKLQDGIDLFAQYQANQEQLQQANQEQMQQANQEQLHLQLKSKEVIVKKVITESIICKPEDKLALAATLAANPILQTSANPVIQATINPVIQANVNSVTHATIIPVSQTVIPVSQTIIPVSQTVIPVTQSGIPVTQTAVNPVTPPVNTVMQAPAIPVTQTATENVNSAAMKYVQCSKVILPYVPGVYKF